MDLYQTLGVARDANASTIKNAYRKQARAAHPDKGGEPTVFAEIATAYAVLSDTAARQHYDATGALPDARNQELVQREEVVKLFILLVDHDKIDVDQHNVLQQMVANAKMKREELLSERAALVKRMDKRTKALHNLKRKDGQPDILFSMWQSLIDEDKVCLAKADAEIAKWKAVLQLATEFTYETKPKVSIVSTSSTLYA